MIKDMDLKLAFQKEKDNPFQILDFAGERFVTGSGLVKTVKYGKRLPELPENVAGRVMPSAVLLSGVPEDGEMAVFALLWQYSNLPVHLVKGAYAMVKHQIENKVHAAAAAGRKQEGKALEAVLDNFKVHEYNEEFSIGSVSVRFLQAGPFLGAASVRLAHGEDSVMLTEISASSELLSGCAGAIADNYNEKTNIICAELPDNYINAEIPEKDSSSLTAPISFEKLAEEINIARRNLGFFFIPAELPRLPLVIKALNGLQQRGILSADIRICPVGTEAGDILRIYEENGIKLDYASAYLRSGIQPASLPREANCGFRIFITPGEDFSDMRGSFSANLLPLVRSNELASVVYPGARLPHELEDILNKKGEKTCRVAACDLTGTPSTGNLYRTVTDSGATAVLLCGCDASVLNQAAGAMSGIKTIIPASRGENISFYKDGNGRVVSAASRETAVLAVTAGELIKSEGLLSAASLLEKCSLGSAPGKVFLFCRKETLSIAEELRRDFLENAEIPAEILMLSPLPGEGGSDENYSAEEKRFVSAVSCLISDFAEVSFFAGGDRILDAWISLFVTFFGMRAFFSHYGRISEMLPFPFPFGKRQLEAYWGNIREIVYEGNSSLVKCVPAELLNIAVIHKNDRYFYSPYGMLLETYCRTSGKNYPRSSAVLPVNDVPHRKNALPEVAVFTVGCSLLENYRRAENNDVPDIGGLSAFIRKDSHNAFQNCCVELKTLFSLPDPALLKNCRRVVFLAPDSADGKTVSAALENFFSGLKIDTETLFIEPYEDNSVYGLYDLGLRNLVSAVGKLKQRFGSLLFLICGGDEIACGYVRLAAQIFHDVAYVAQSGNSSAVKLPSFPLEADISEYSSLRNFMDIVLDLNMVSRYDRLPECLKEKVLHKTEHGMAFTALQPLLETVHLIKHPADVRPSSVRNKPHETLTASFGNGDTRPFFMVKPKHIVKKQEQAAGNKAVAESGETGSSKQ